MSRPTAGARLILVRHGETDFNREGRWQGAGSDPPLNATGIEQAAALVPPLASVELAAIYTSPLIRAMQTAEPVARAHGLPPGPLDAMREMHHGEWEGRTKDEILAGWCAEYEAFEADPAGVRRPGGESYGDLEARMWPALERLASRHAGEQALIVTHAGPIRLVVSQLTGRPLTERTTFGVDNGKLFFIDRVPDGWRLARS